MISKTRRNKANKFIFKKDAYRCVFAEILLSYCLYEKFNKKIQIDLKYNKFGKPSLKNINNFFFNISHSGNWVIVAYGKTEVGVDIEKIRPNNPLILKKILSNEEKKNIYFSNKKIPNSLFTKIWCAKESYLKYIGTGFSTAMSSFSVDISKCSVTDNHRTQNNKLQIKILTCNNNYCLAICSEEKQTKIKKITLKDIENIYENLK